MNTVYSIVLTVLALCIIASLVYAALGRRFTDKIVAANLVCTLTVNTICVLAAFRLEDYVLDIAILFTLLSFLSVQILCQVVSLHHKGRLRHLKDKHPEETAKEALDRLEREEEGHYHINEEAHV